MEFLVENLRITLTNALSKEHLIDDLLESICDNTDVRSLECMFCDQVWIANVGMMANAEVFAVLLALTYPDVRAKL